MNWIVVIATFFIGAIAYYALFSSKKKKVKNAKKVSLPDADLLGPNPTAKSEPKATPAEDDIKAASEEGSAREIVKLKTPIRVDPKSVIFSVPTDQQTPENSDVDQCQTVRIMNNSNMMGVFKVRTNRRKRYVVCPSIYYLKPGQSYDVKSAYLVIFLVLSFARA